jgi:hypothetical protein
MPEGHAGPGNSSVTIVTGHGRWDMRGRFPLHHVVVVARRTTSWHDTIMSEEGRFPIGGAVATITVHSRRQMVGRFERGDDSPAGRVALHTLRRGSPKNALHVTPLAHNLGVAAAEREAGAAVVDFNVRAATSLGRGGIWHQQHRAANRQKPGNNCTGKETMSCPTSHSSHSRIRRCATPLGCDIFAIGIIIPITRCGSSAQIVGTQSQTQAQQGTCPLQRKHRKFVISIRDGCSALGRSIH